MFLTCIENPLVLPTKIHLINSIWSVDQVAEHHTLATTLFKVQGTAYLYFITSANKNESWKLLKLPPFGAFTSVISEKPDPTLVVALMALNAFQAH